MIRLHAILTLVCCAFAPALAVSQEMHMAAHSNPAFDQFKSLVGHWEGSTSSGRKVSVSFELISNGTVLMERLSPGNEPDMITMYSLEGDRIQATHYCSAGNQPTMQTAPSPAADGKYQFTFSHLGGAKSPSEGHMDSLSVSIPDKNHLIQTWIFMDHGKTQSENFTYTRKS
jgi:hypothetical protein